MTNITNSFGSSKAKLIHRMLLIINSDFMRNHIAPFISAFHCKNECEIAENVLVRIQIWRSCLHHAFYEYFLAFMCKLPVHVLFLSDIRFQRLRKIN